MPEATMAQRISRAKAQIRDAGARFELPEGERLGARLVAVSHVLYLIFNEGYLASSGRQLVRTDLSNEAIRLTRLLHRLVEGEPEVSGLLALMLLTDSRRAARTGPAGEVIPLDEQDRTSWDAAEIDEGLAMLQSALQRGRVGPYQLQAAIAAVHARARTVEDTDWAQILTLYTLLDQSSDNPMVKLNLAVAIAMVHGPQAGLERLARLETDARLQGNHRVHAVRGHLLERAGNPAQAADEYRKAAGKTNSDPERTYLLLRAARLPAPTSPGGD